MSAVKSNRGRWTIVAIAVLTLLLLSSYAVYQVGQGARQSETAIALTPSLKPGFQTAAAEVKATQAEAVRIYSITQTAKAQTPSQ